MFWITVVSVINKNIGEDDKRRNRGSGPKMGGPEVVMKKTYQIKEVVMKNL